MVAGDADALGALLAGDFTLVHMTGYRQSGAEWLADVRSGAMTYHSMEDADVDVDVSGDVPVVTARTRTAATIWAPPARGRSSCASPSPKRARHGSRRKPSPPPGAERRRPAAQQHGLDAGALVRDPA